VAIILPKCDIRRLSPKLPLPVSTPPVYEAARESPHYPKSGLNRVAGPSNRPDDRRRSNSLKSPRTRSRAIWKLSLPGSNRSSRNHRARTRQWNPTKIRIEGRRMEKAARKTNSFWIHPSSLPHSSLSSPPMPPWLDITMFSAILRFFSRWVPSPWAFMIVPCSRGRRGMGPGLVQEKPRRFPGIPPPLLTVFGSRRNEEATSRNGRQCASLRMIRTWR